MTDQTIARQVETFNEGFTAQIGPELSAVFDGEQRDLRDAGVPDGVVAVGDAAPDAPLVTRPATPPRSPRPGVPSRPSSSSTGRLVPVLQHHAPHVPAELLPALQERGVQLVAVSPQTPEAAEQSIANGELVFPVLTDPENVLAGRFGIVTEPSAAARGAHTQLGFDVADSNADATAAIPFPSVFVIDAEGVVRFADVHVDYTTRTEVATVVAAVDDLLVANR